MGIVSTWKRLALAAGAVSALSMTGAAAFAHPHVFIKVRTSLILEAGALVGLHHIWIMDEQWLASQLESHDRDGDGKLSAEELAPLVAESKATLEMFKSFTTLRHAGQRVRPAGVQHLEIGTYGDRLGLSFVATLAKPLPLAGTELLLEVYDGTYFSGFAFADSDAVEFAGQRPAGCVVNGTAQPSPQQVAVHRMMTRQLGPEFNAKAALPQAASVTCSKTLQIGSGAPADAVGLHVPVSAGR